MSDSAKRSYCLRATLDIFGVSSRLNSNGFKLADSFLSASYNEYGVGVANQAAPINGATQPLIPTTKLIAIGSTTVSMLLIEIDSGSIDITITRSDTSTARIKCAPIVILTDTDVATLLLSNSSLTNAVTAKVRVFSKS